MCTFEGSSIRADAQPARPRTASGSGLNGSRSPLLASHSQIIGVLLPLRPRLPSLPYVTGVDRHGMCLAAIYWFGGEVSTRCGFNGYIIVT